MKRRPKGTKEEQSRHRNKPQPTEFQIEWLYSHLRWFYILLVGATPVFLGGRGTPLPDIALALVIVGSVANLMVMILLAMHAFRTPMTAFTFTLDLSLALGLITTTGGVDSPLLFIAFFPILTAALRFPWGASLLVDLAVVLLYWAAAWHSHTPPTPCSREQIWEAMHSYLLNGFVLLLAGATTTLVGYRLRRALRREQEEQQRQAQAELRAAHQRIRLIFELASTLSATLNYERVLQAVLDISQAGLQEFVGRDIPLVQAILLFGMDQTLYIASSRGLTNSDHRTRFAAEEGALAEVLHRAEPLVIEDPGSDPELGNLVAMHQCREAILVPLRAGFESYGVVLMGSPEEGAYPNEFQDLLEAVCNQAVLALQNAQLYQNLIEEKERLVAVEEDARKKLARDLHDGPTQTIAAIAMRLNYIHMLIDRDPRRAKQEVAELEKLARMTTKEIRQMLFTLRPLVLETQGLAAALEQLRNKLAETDPMHIHLEIEPQVDDDLTPEAQGALFYIIEEAVNNARKHAEATDLWIRLYRRQLTVVAEVEDNGKGFDVSKVEEKYATRGSLGMMNLVERAKLVKGKTVIQSAPGQGTKVITTVPIRGRRGRR